MTQSQRAKKAEQLRLAAQIVETGAEWELKTDEPESKWLGSESPFVAAFGDAGKAVAHGYEIRIKEPVIPVPEGWRELRDEEKDRRWIEGAKWLNKKGEWGWVGVHRAGAFAIRTQRIIVPVAKPRVPLEPCDVPPGTCIKPSDEYVGWGMVCEVDATGIHLFASRHLSWNDLMNNNWSIKRPADTEWQPCSKEAP